MAADPKHLSTSTDYIVSGIFIGLLAGIAGYGAGVATNATVGWVVFGAIGAVAQVVLLIGIIARGVEVGNRSRT